MPRNPKDDKPPLGDKRFTLESLSPSKIRNAPPRGADPAQRVRLITRVRTADYVPPNVKVRTQVDPHLFTAECDVGDLPSLENDPQVESVEIAEVLLPIGGEKK